MSFEVGRKFWIAATRISPRITAQGSTRDTSTVPRNTIRSPGATLSASVSSQTCPTTSRPPSSATVTPLTDTSGGPGGSACGSSQKRRPG